MIPASSAPCAPTPRSLKVRYCRQSLFFPVANSTKLDRFIACLQKSFSGARRAPTSSSIEDDLGVFGKFAHARLELIHRNVNRTGDRATLGDFLRFANVDKDWFVFRLEFLLKVRYRYALRLHSPMIQ